MRAGPGGGGTAIAAKASMRSGRRCAPSARARPRPRGQPDGAAQATRSVIALPSPSPWTVAVAEPDDVDNRWGHQGRRGSREPQSDERGRTAMTEEDAERRVRFANLRLRMLTTPSSSPRAKVAFMCALPNRRTVVWSGDPAEWRSSRAPMYVVINRTPYGRGGRGRCPGDTSRTRRGPGSSGGRPGAPPSPVGRPWLRFAVG